MVHAGQPYGAFVYTLRWPPFCCCGFSSISIDTYSERNRGSSELIGIHRYCVAVSAHHLVSYDAVLTKHVILSCGREMRWVRLQRRNADTTLTHASCLVLACHTWGLCSGYTPRSFLVDICRCTCRLWNSRVTLKTMRSDVPGRVPSYTSTPSD